MFNAITLNPFVRKYESWDVRSCGTLCKVEWGIPYRRFRTTYLFHLQGSSIPRRRYVHKIEICTRCAVVLKSINFLFNTGLFVSPSAISELDCATTKKDTAERSISIAREPLQVFFVLGGLAYFQVPPPGGSLEKKMAFTVNKKAFCVLEVAKTESVVTVQRRFRIMYHTEPPTDKTVREWYMNSSRVAACSFRTLYCEMCGHEVSSIGAAVSEGPSVSIFSALSQTILVFWFICGFCNDSFNSLETAPSSNKVIRKQRIGKGLQKSGRDLNSGKIAVFPCMV